MKGNWRTRTRTVVLHERVECPPLGIVVLPMAVGPIKRPGFEVCSALELGVIVDLGSPLVRGESVGVPDRRKGMEHERRPRYSHIPMPGNRERAATRLARTTTRH